MDVWETSLENFIIGNSFDIKIKNILGDRVLLSSRMHETQDIDR